MYTVFILTLLRCEGTQSGCWIFDYCVTYTYFSSWCTMILYRTIFCLLFALYCTGPCYRCYGLISLVWNIMRNLCFKIMIIISREIIWVYDDSDVFFGGKDVFTDNDLLDWLLHAKIRYFMFLYIRVWAYMWGRILCVYVRMIVSVSWSECVCVRMAVCIKVCQGVYV